MNSFIKIFCIIIKNVRCSLAHNLIMVLFTATAVFFTNISLASFRYSNHLNEFSKTSGLYDSFMFVGNSTKRAYSEASENGGEDLSVKANEYVMEELEQLKSDGTIADYTRSCGVGDGVFSEETGVDAEFCFIKLDMLKKLSVPVAEGDWFDTCPPDYCKKDMIPVVIGDNLKSVYGIGEVFTRNFGEVKIKCMVTGILEHGTLFLNPNVGGSGMDLNTTVQSADSMVIVAQEYSDSYGSFFIRLPEKNRVASEQAVLGKIADISAIFSFRYLTDKAWEDNSYGIEMQTTLAVLALLICISGIACGNLLSYARGKKRQAVYFLCGMKPGTGVFCMVLENLLKLYFPAAAGLYVFFAYCRRQEYQDLFPGVYNVWITGAFITVIFAASIVRPFSIAKGSVSLNIVRLS